MSSLRLTNCPPPDWMPDVGEHFHVVNRAGKTCRCHGPQPIRETIERETEEIRLLMTRFSTMVLTGTMRIVIFPTTYMLSGELTTYHVPIAPQRDALVTEIDRRVFTLKHTYGQHIERVEIWCEQVYDKNARVDPKPSLREISLQEYAALAVRQGATCFNCRHPLTEDNLEHYGPHPDGWRVKGYPVMQWLFMRCPKCRYQTSLAKLKIARPVPSAT